MEEKYVIRGPERLNEPRQESIGERVYNQLLQYQDFPVALTDGVTNETVSYKSLLENSCSLATWMENLGVKQDDVIGIFSENSVYYFYPVLAAIYLTATVTTINSQYQLEELVNCLNVSKPSIIFCSQSALPRLLEIKSQFTFIKNIVLIDSNTANSSNIKCLEDIFSGDSHKTNFKPYKISETKQTPFILYSSGTTGLPKGVMITHKNIHFVLDYLTDPRYQKPEQLGFTATIGLLPFFHIYGLACGLGSFILGRKIVVMKLFEPDVYLETIQKYKVSTLYLVPPLANFLAKSLLVDKYDISSVETIVCGAAPLSKKIEEILMKRFNINAILPSYGLTEGTPLLGYTLEEFKPGSCGKVLPGHLVKIIDPETGKALGPNQKGELCYKGDTLMKGYVNNMEATKATIDKDGWLHSGDVGYYDEDGYFYMVDRIKELIKYKGFQVPPAEIEAILLSHPNIIDAGVVGFPDEIAGELPIAFVVIDPKHKLSEEEIKKFVAERISPQKRLHGGVRFVEEIPKNPSGKLLRRKLRELLMPQQSKL